MRIRNLKTFTAIDSSVTSFFLARWPNIVDDTVHHYIDRKSWFQSNLSILTKISL